jgi:hypothetical protein
VPGKKGVAKSDRSRMSSYTSAHFGLQLSSPAFAPADENGTGARLSNCILGRLGVFSPTPKSPRAIVRHSAGYATA